MSNVSSKIKEEVHLLARRLFNMSQERDLMFSLTSKILREAFPDREYEFRQKSDYTASEYLYTLNECLEFLRERSAEGRSGEYSDEDKLAGMNFTLTQFLESLRVEIEQVKAVEDARHEAALNEIVEDFKSLATPSEDAVPEKTTEKDPWEEAFRNPGSAGANINGRSLKLGIY